MILIATGCITKTTLQLAPSIFNQLWISMPTVPVAVPTVMQNSLHPHDFWLYINLYVCMYMYAPSQWEIWATQEQKNHSTSVTIGHILWYA